ncbi:MAG TPA: hypothetical protein VFZ23_17050 [Pyrinomonadaceae bacterium]
MTATQLQTNGSRPARSERRIAFLVPRGEVVRNFGYSGALKLISQDASLSLLSVSTRSHPFDLEGVDGIFPLDEVMESWIVRIQREILEVAHGRWLWSRAAKERWKLRDNEARTIKTKAKRYAKKTISRPFSTKAGLNILSRTERASSRLFNVSHQYLDLYKRLRPSLVFNGSHVHSRNAIHAVQSAQWLGIPTATFIFSWDNLTSQGRIILPYDYFLVWNQSLKDQLIGMYDWIRPENVFVTGTPQFDFHFRPEFYVDRKEFCESIGADPERPIVFYATGMANHMPGEPEIVEAIADMLNEAEPGGRPQLVVRVYPKDQTGRFEDLKRRRPDILFPEVEWETEWLTPKFEDTYALVNTLRHCALGINVASTISLELCMFDKPVINVGYNPRSVPESEISYSGYYEFDHYKPVVQSGAVTVARSEQQMRDLIWGSLRNPENGRAQRKKLIDDMFGDTLDGNSSRRVAETLVRLAGRKNS